LAYPLKLGAYEDDASFHAEAASHHDLCRQIYQIAATWHPVSGDANLLQQVIALEFIFMPVWPVTSFFDDSTHL
jgi:hypothetical protein